MLKLKYQFSRKRLRAVIGGTAQMAKLDDDVAELIKNSGPLTLAEIAEKMGKPEKQVYKAVRRLFEKELIDCVNRKYALAKK